MQQENIGDTNFDKQFKQIEKLTWLPWVGKDYSILPTNRKLLLVAESNYDWHEEGSVDDLADSNFTRWIINHDGIEGSDFYRRIMRNIEKALFNDNPRKEQKIKLWESVGYYNIVQRYMETPNHRPTYDDFSIGWDTFFKIIGILQPEYCLFCGVTASNSFQAFEKNSFNADNIQCLDKVDNVYPRIAKVTSKEGHTTKLVFIKHPSKYFSWESWAEFIEQQMGEYTAWLRKN
ncbi:MAG: hypothetical protein HY063_08095 [Bacteroidetes bacterium]|nr:hypothetical protein [Bacteroidota bacterium]